MLHFKTLSTNHLTTFSTIKQSRDKESEEDVGQKAQKKGAKIVEHEFKQSYRLEGGRRKILRTMGSGNELTTRWHTRWHKLQNKIKVFLTCAGLPRAAKLCRAEGLKKGRTYPFVAYKPSPIKDRIYMIQL